MARPSIAPSQAWYNFNGGDGITISHRSLHPSADGSINWRELRDFDMVLIRIQNPELHPVVPDIGAKPRVLRQPGFGDVVLLAQITGVRPCPAHTAVKLTAFEGGWLTIELDLPSDRSHIGNIKIAAGPKCPYFGRPAPSPALQRRQFAKSMLQYCHNFGKTPSLTRPS